MSALDRIRRIGERWFLTEPLLFAVYCSHDFVENGTIDVPMRTGNMKVEFAPKILDKVADDVLQEYLKIEMFRILLKHPYQRQPPFAEKALLTMASNITIADVYEVSREVKKQMGGTEQKLPSGLCFEEYYNLLLQNTTPNSGKSSGESQQSDDKSGQEGNGSSDSDNAGQGGENGGSSGDGSQSGDCNGSQGDSNGNISSGAAN